MKQIDNSTLPDGTQSGVSSNVGIIEQNLRQQEQLNNQQNQISPLRCFFKALSRKKPLDTRTETNLHRCLDLIDLTTLGEFRILCSDPQPKVNLFTN